MESDGEQVTREVEIEATPEEVWESLASEEGRERWLDTDGERKVEIDVAEEPRRLVWHWTVPGEESTRVEFRIEAIPAGTRVRVTETASRLPLTALADSLMAVAA